MRTTAPKVGSEGVATPPPRTLWSSRLPSVHHNLVYSKQFNCNINLALDLHVDLTVNVVPLGLTITCPVNVVPLGLTITCPVNVVPLGLTITVLLMWCH